ncbi:MAG: non-homologous end-joining DNA ligase [Desulfotomaculaceae bacterium]|nr:non-homologous end-joining DNA ligase [Desulfotomaculaceae bacterium]MDD4766029.1 non-homologous end-joining DNA ligase [Desulfotomaculaceae bacterium]
MKKSFVKVDGHEVKLTNLDKLIWPEGLTKAHLVKYYSDIAPYILPHLYNRPVVMKRYPDGLAGEAFYQKEVPNYAPDWITRQPVGHTEKVINYIICNDRATLIWLANQACIEMHAWLARLENLECPDLAVMDMDPADGATFADILEIALLVKHILDEFGIECFPKTSGSRGLHLFIPLEPVYSWQKVTRSMKYVAELAQNVYPDKVTLERKVEKRVGKVYLDYLQNGRGRTMAFQYSLRPRPGAPVSTPLLWEEVEIGDFQPGDYNINTIFSRISKLGDVFAGVLKKRQNMKNLLNMIKFDNMGE